ncbi:hypothetical protein AB0C11_39740 [Streptomyces sp. NPDC039016]|uniref:hypothetical protein n=1 Tax=Streptomyces sp. NPDC039016 TaxID=3154330 RepID=UPI00340A13F9
MSTQNVPPDGQESPPTPAPGTLMVDATGRVGEFRGEWCGLWSLRPANGGSEWTVDPNDVEPASAEQRIHAETARANARSRGEIL